MIELQPIAPLVVVAALLAGSVRYAKAKHECNLKCRLKPDWIASHESEPEEPPVEHGAQAVGDFLSQLYRDIVDCFGNYSRIGEDGRVLTDADAPREYTLMKFFTVTDVGFGRFIKIMNSVFLCLAVGFLCYIFYAASNKDKNVSA
ncbi:Ku domain-containing protein [Babesia ovata]|uniref:Ku domain-containing protein n=1 Tax=Babesia ovata TaxID=189622 RepID=A0A2H6K791_9APIC|nr:Ku domain-containing protein [Babesia ovata]GBE58819.1 Ku domain-containing protein [Babesia ovata]